MFCTFSQNAWLQRQHPCFNRQTAWQLSAVAQALTLLHLNAGEQLLYRHESHMYFVLTGSLFLLEHKPEGVL